MKKVFLFLICLFAITLQAKQYKVNLTYNDGTVKSGFSELVNTKTKNINFRISEKGKSEKISSEELSRMVFFNQKGDSVVVERLYNNNLKDTGEIKKSKEKGWYYLYYSNGLKIAGGNAVEIEKIFSKGEISFNSEVSYYLGKEGEEAIYYLYYNSPKNIAILGGFNLDEEIMKISNHLFKDSCPDLITKIENEKFKFKDAMEKLAEFYNSSCKKTNPL